MKPKHKPCINCGANKYEPIEDGFKCEYCGTEYENEREITPFSSVEFSPYITCFTGTVAMPVYGTKCYHSPMEYNAEDYNPKTRTWKAK